MARTDVIQFREYLRSHPECEREMREQIKRNGSIDNVAYARKLGFHFTEQEAETAWEEIAGVGDLTDFELEMVSAGGRSPTNSEKSTSSDLGSANQPG